MELGEFVRLDPEQIRRDKKLMQLYMDFHRVAFSFEPKCSGCSFKKGFNKLRTFYNKKNVKLAVNKSHDMKTFELKKEFRLKILSFKKNGKTHRSYGYQMTEDFALELAKSRPEYFVRIPEGAPSKFEDMDYMKELKPLYNEISARTGKKAKSNKKDDIISFLKQYGG